MTDTDKASVSILFDVMAGQGVRDVVCSPGSRNAPLLIAAASRESLRKHVVIDERSAAFMALGMAVVSRRPVALVCTSGTAFLNYGPAVAEAYYQGIPLIVISADRPAQWIDQDDSQTLRQFGALSNFVKKSYQLSVDTDNVGEREWYANRIANDALIEATSGRQGPVHINVPLGEPLNGRRSGNLQTQRIIECLQPDSFGNKETMKCLAGQLDGKKIMFVAGFMQPDAAMHKAAAMFCSHPNVVAMTETLSNLKLGGGACDVDCVLSAWPDEVLDGYAPDVVISVGGSLVSRKLKEYLRRNAVRCTHWYVGRSLTTSDCLMSMTKRIEVEPARFLRMLSVAMRKYASDTTTNAYAQSWKELRQEAMKVKRRFIENAPWSGLKAYRCILDNLPADCNLFLSNGTTVRYAQLFNENLPHASYCNRGVSGIDGSLSSAVGGAVASKRPTVAVTGDMSMAYDINALALPGIPDNMKIIVVDNCGGGIFRFIGSTSSLPERENYFCAPPRLPLKQLADGYGWNYREATGETPLQESLNTFFKEKRKGILKVTVPPEESAEVLKGYMKAIGN